MAVEIPAPGDDMIGHRSDPPRDDLEIRVIPAREMTACTIDDWSAVQAAEPMFDNPFFRPEFTSLAAAVRDDVYVAQIMRAGEAVGFFPFQRDRDGRGLPVGGHMADYQAVIVRRDVRWNAVQLLRAAGLSEWRFDHLLREQKEFETFHRIRTDSPVIDLSGGYADYERTHLHGLAELRKRRKLEREVGPLRFSIHSPSREMFQLLLRWKSAQYVHSGKRDIFAIEWVAGLLERVHLAQEPNLGLMSVLSAGDQPIAVHLGMRSQKVWHYWIPSFDPAFGHYSPGMLLLLEMAAAASSLGLEVIDFGKGRALYKQRLSNRSIPLAEGVVPAGVVRGALARARHRVETVLRQSPWFASLRRARTAFIQSRREVRARLNQE